MAPRFLGRYEHSLDSKGRVVLPARFRAHFGQSAVLTQNTDGCLAIWTEDGFGREYQRMSQLQDQDAEGRQQARVWAASASDTEIDAQGRVMVPPYLRSFAGLDGAVLVTGAMDRVELWSPQVWERKVQPAEEGIRNPRPQPPVPTDPSTPTAPVSLTASTETDR